MTEQPQDGFDAIEYPLDYSFKVVCDNNTFSQKQELSPQVSKRMLENLMRNTVVSIVGSQAVKQLSSKESSAGRYVSITVVAQLINRTQLEKVYSALASCPEVRMTL